MRRPDLRTLLGFVLGLVATGFLALAEPWYGLYALGFVVALLLAGRVRGRWVRHAVEALPLAWFLTLAILGTQLFGLLAQSMLVALLSRFVLTENARDQQGQVLIALFITVLSAAGSISLAFGVLLVAEFFTATLLLIVAQFPDRIPRLSGGFYGTILAVTVLSFIVAGLLFFALPRLALGTSRGSPALVAQTTGFSRDVTITPGAVEQDHTIVMRIEPLTAGERVPLPAYISGLRYTTFTGRQWLVGTGRPEPLYALNGLDMFEVGDGSPDRFTTVYLEPTGTDVLFGLERVVSVRGLFQQLRRDDEGNILLQTPVYKTLRYDVGSLDGGGAFESSQPTDPARYLQVPPLSQAFKNIALHAAQGATVREKASAVQAYLTDNYVYSLNPTATSVEDFVVDNRTGYCEHFATAMALLLRSEGVPCRLVSGFVATEWNSTSGYLIVRASDAHTWVEVLDGTTWLRYDPTPASFQEVSQRADLLDSLRMVWYRAVITYDLSAQLEAARSLSTFFGGMGGAIAHAVEGLRAAATRLVRNWRFLAGATAAPLLIVIVLRHLPDRRHGRVAAAFEELAGERRRPGETLLELARRRDPTGRLEDLAWQVYSIRFTDDASGAAEHQLLLLLHAERGRRL
ncbi:MAG TPA: DUF3488 and transglutaminase-like domain-containing protein [Candidatus Cryosericum sp.]|nr:DUF3488 and transglutaminase-like domain-containing protein [Candidatus Cryosericum sp.]